MSTKGKQELVRVPTAEESGVRAVALIDRLKERGYAIQPRVFDNLAVAGLYGDDTQAAVIAMAVVAGMDPNQLIYPENIRTVGKAYQWTASLGAVPGDHYYLVPYNDRDDKNKKVYAAVAAVRWLRLSVDKHGLATGVRYVPGSKPVLGAKLDELLEYHVPGYIPDPGNRGHLFRFAWWINGQCATDPDGNWEFGYFLARGKKNDKGWTVGNDSVLLQGNAASNTPARRAATRAERLASYAVTRILAPVDMRSMEEHLANSVALLQMRLASGQLPQLPVEEAFVESELPEEGEYRDAPEPQREPQREVIIAHQEPAETQTPAPDGEETSDLAERVYDALHASGEQAALLLESLVTARAGKSVLDATQRQLQEFMAQAAQVEADEEFAGGLLVDFLIEVVFGVPAGKKISVAQAEIFFPKIAERKGKAWEFASESFGARLVADAIDIIAEMTDSGVEKTF